MDNILILRDFCSIAREELDEALRSHALLTDYPILNPVVEYAIFPAGKRLRPLLSLLVAHELGGDYHKLVRAAIAIEIVHCASLVHDDLPVLDNDDFRRGRPSCHKRFGDGKALLAGDYMIPLAIKLVSESGLPASDVRALVIELSNAFLSVCHGQAIDIGHPAERGDLWNLHRQKTGALFGCSFAFGAIGASLSPQSVAIARKLGESFGILFQILDDLTDRYGTDEERGRKGSSDERNDKVTVTSLPKQELYDKVWIIQREMIEGINELRGAAQRKTLPLLEAQVGELTEHLLRTLSKHMSS